MWIFSTIGFFSLTQSRDEPGKMHFRGRERVDLENLCARFDIAYESILETPQADYRFRLVLPPAQAIQIVTALAQDIDYSNFKNAVHQNPTQERKGTPYMRIWATMNALQPAPDPMSGEPALWERYNFGDHDPRVLDNPKARTPRRKTAAKVRKAVVKCGLCQKAQGRHHGLTQACPTTPGRYSTTHTFTPEAKKWAPDQIKRVGKKATA